MKKKAPNIMENDLAFEGHRDRIVEVLESESVRKLAAERKLAGDASDKLFGQIMKVVEEASPQHHLEDTIGKHLAEMINEVRESGVSPFSAAFVETFCLPLNEWITDKWIKKEGWEPGEDELNALRLAERMAWQRLGS